MFPHFVDLLTCDDVADFTYMPSSDDCKNYTWCFPGPHSRTCPDGEIFNPGFVQISHVSATPICVALSGHTCELRKFV